MAEFSAGLQTRQEDEGNCNFAILTSSGGKFYEFFMTIVLAIPPLTVKNRRRIRCLLQIFSCRSSVRQVSTIWSGH